MNVVLRFKYWYNVLISTGGYHLFGSTVINRILSLLSSLILVRLIPKEEYGIYANANNILGLFCIVESLGMTAALLQYGCVCKGREKEEIWSFTFYVGFIFNILLCISIIATALFADFTISGTDRYLLAMAVLPLIRSISEMQRIYVRTEFRNKEYAAINTFSTTIIVFLSIVLAVVLLVYGVILAHYVAGVLTILYVSYYIKVTIPKWNMFLVFKRKLELMKFAMIATVNNSSALIMYLLDTFILGVVVAQATVTASYKVALTIPAALSFIPSCVLTYIYPHFAKHHDDGGWLLRMYKKILLLFSGFNLVLVGVLYAVAPQVISVIFGTQYLDAVPAFRILCLNYFFSSALYAIAGSLLVTQNKLVFNMIIGFLCLAINLALNLTLIPVYSSTGAAVATLVSSLVGGIISSAYLYSVFKRF